MITPWDYLVVRSIPHRLDVYGLRLEITTTKPREFVVVGKSGGEEYRSSDLLDIHKFLLLKCGE